MRFLAAPRIPSPVPGTIRRVDRRIAIGIVALLAQLGGACNAIRYGVPSLWTGHGEQQLVMTLDPVDLPAGADEHHMGPQPSVKILAVPVAGWVHGYSVEVIDAKGDTVPSGVLHHMKLLLPSKRELFMPIAMRAAGAGSETRSVRIPRTLGFAIDRSDTLMLTAMLHSPTGRDLKGVRVRLTLSYTPVTSGRSTTVYPFFMHVTAPGGPSSFDLPPGYSERSWAARPAVGGYILGLGGHLHRYGVSLRLEDATTGRELWRTRARTDAGGNILSVPRKLYMLSRGIRIYPDHTYRLTAAYRNPTGRVIANGGMGTIGGVIRPLGSWPSVDRSDSLYAWDLNREMAGDTDMEMDMPMGSGTPGRAPEHRH